MQVPLPARTTLILSAFLNLCVAGIAPAVSGFEQNGSTTWRSLHVGAGGWLTGLDISTDGSTVVVRADTYGAYILNVASSQWRQVVTTSSMPAPDRGVDMNSGVYEIRIAPSLPTRVYMAYRGYVYRSDNRALEWSRTTFVSAPMDANDDFRTMGPKMAIDPANSNVVYIGTPKNGLFVTSDGGNTWHTISAVPKSARASNGQYPGYTGIVFDSTSGAAGGKTARIYVGSYGNGVWASVDRGITWVRTPDGPSTIRHIVLASDGSLYATDNDGGINNTWKYFNDSWINLKIGKYHSIAVDPSNPSRILVATEGGTINQSFDGGQTWTGNYLPTHPRNSGVRVATDIPWLGSD